MTLLPPTAAEVAVLRPRSDGNKVALFPFFYFSASIARRRRLAASLAGLLLGLLPAAVQAQPKIDEPLSRPVEKEVTGSLVIVGGGLLPDTIRERFLELAGGKNGRLVVIPTASKWVDQTRISRSFNYWKAQGLASVSLLHTHDPKEADDPSFVKPLKAATAAWLGGGDQSRLANAYHGTAVEKELQRLLARGGVIGGTSAGASVMSAIMITGGNPQARTGQGFGLLPNVVIDQHFQNRKRQTRLIGVLANHPRCLGLGIDEKTAVVLHGHTLTVLGKANVSVCLPPTEGYADNVKLLKSGEVCDLLQFRESLISRLKSPAQSKPMADKTSSRATMP
jgi:cyanophycinase